VIIATDVFIYLGKLDEIISEAKRLLCPNGIFAFSIESLEASENDEARQECREYQLESTGRYTHSIPYLTRLAAANDFLPQEIAATQLRLEKGKPVNGHLVLWKNRNFP
jgi:predicted TPR repeat methyltransferase